MDLDGFWYILFWYPKQDDFTKGNFNITRYNEIQQEAMYNLLGLWWSTAFVREGSYLLFSLRLIVLNLHSLLVKLRGHVANDKTQFLPSAFFH